MTEQFPIVAVGGGPAGISLAIECIEMGMKPEDILILEKGPLPIFAIEKFYPEKKMTLANYKNLPTETQGHIPKFPDLTKAETRVYFNDLIKKYKLQMRLKSDVSKITREGDRFRVQVNKEVLIADQVGIGIGILGRPNKPLYKLPIKLRQHLLFDLTSQPVKDCKVLIVGGGDTSSEYAQVLVLDGCDVTLAYRRDKFVRMMDTNLQAVKNLVNEGQIKVHFSCEVQEILDEGGKPKIVFKNSDNHEPEIFDKVIYAIGGTTPVNFLKTIGVEFDEKWPKMGPSGETNIAGCFLLGDLTVGRTGGSIILAYNSAFRAAQQMLEKVGSK